MYTFDFYNKMYSTKSTLDSTDDCSTLITSRFTAGISRQCDDHEQTKVYEHEPQQLTSTIVVSHDSLECLACTTQQIKLFIVFKFIILMTSIFQRPKHENLNLVGGIAIASTLAHDHLACICRWLFGGS